MSNYQKAIEKLEQCWINGDGGRMFDDYDGPKRVREALELLKGYRQVMCSYIRHDRSHAGYSRLVIENHTDDEFAERADILIYGDDDG